MTKVKISYYSDVLCIWAYVGHRRLEQLIEDFGSEIVVDVHYCSVFPDAWGKIEQNWKAQGGFKAFNGHVNDVAKQFPHVEVRSDLWISTKPRTSASAHLFLKAVEAIEFDQFGEEAAQQPFLERQSTHAAWALRLAFFAEARDISDWRVHREIADQINIDYEQVEKKIHSSEAITQLAIDYNLSQVNRVEGSPTFLMNNGRQRLFGNVGYRLLQANVQELLRGRAEDTASWC